MNRRILAVVVAIITLASMGCGSDIQGSIVIPGQTMNRNTLVVSADSLVRAGQVSKLGGMGLQGDAVDAIFAQIPSIGVPMPPEPNSP